MIPFRSLFSRWAVLMAREPFDWPDTSVKHNGEEGLERLLCICMQCVNVLLGFLENHIYSFLNSSQSEGCSPKASDSR